MLRIMLKNGKHIKNKRLRLAAAHYDHSKSIFQNAHTLIYQFYNLTQYV